MSKIQLHSFADFEGEVQKLHAYLKQQKGHEFSVLAKPVFRGQANVDWPLATTVERYLPEVATSLEDYNRYLARIHPAVETLTEKRWDFELQPDKPKHTIYFHPPNYEFMVYCRHHGFPSPILDWTRSPYVALFFAFQNAQPNTFVSVSAFVSTPNGTKAAFEGTPTIHELGPYIAAHERHFLQQSVFTMCTQEGEYGLEYCSHHKCFGSETADNDLLRIYSMPSSLRLEVLKRLDQMNINEHSLFRNVEGLMSTVAFREILVAEE